MLIEISGVNIRQNADGLYCLNDLHEAAGKEDRHRPSLWSGNDQTKALVAELEAEIPASKALVTRRGRGVTGTYALKELVYAYAAWISPAFHIYVLRTFDVAMQEKYARKEAEVGVEEARMKAAMFFTEQTLSHLPNLGETAKQCLLSIGSELAFGRPLIPLPKVEEPLLNATQVGEILGISATMVGRVANKYGLKTSDHGEVRLDKSRYSAKMVENFFYNQAGVAAVRAVLGS